METTSGTDFALPFPDAWYDERVTLVCDLCGEAYMTTREQSAANGSHERCADCIEFLLADA